MLPWGPGARDALAAAAPVAAWPALPCLCNPGGRAWDELPRAPDCPENGCWPPQHHSPTGAQPAAAVASAAAAHAPPPPPLPPPLQAPGMQQLREAGLLDDRHLVAALRTRKLRVEAALETLTDRQASGGQGQWAPAAGGRGGGGARGSETAHVACRSVAAGRSLRACCRLAAGRSSSMPTPTWSQGSRCAAGPAPNCWTTTIPSAHSPAACTMCTFPPHLMPPSPPLLPLPPLLTRLRR